MNPNGMQLQRALVWLGVTGLGLGLLSPLSAQQPQFRNALLWHYDQVSSVAFSPDGKTLASGSRDKTINLWDVATGKNTAARRWPAEGKITATLRGHTDWVESVAFSPDGKILASGSADATIKLWDMASGKNTATLQGHAEWVYRVAFSPDGKALASANRDKTIHLWDVATGKQTATLQGHAWSMAFSPDGKALASGNSDGKIKLWNVASGKETTTLLGHIPGETHSVAFSPDGKFLASGGCRYDKLGESGELLRVSGEIKLWNLATGRNINPFWSITTRYKINSVAFSPDGKKLASGDSDQSIQLWDVAGGKISATLSRHNGKTTSTPQGHNGSVSSVAFSPDGKTLASGSVDQTIKFWDFPGE